MGQDIFYLQLSMLRSIMGSSVWLPEDEALEVQAYSRISAMSR